MSLQFQKLENRLLFAVTPANDLTIPIRQTLLNDLTISIKSTLQNDLNASNATAFDNDLLNFMLSQNTHFFWQLSDDGSISNYITTNIGDGGASLSSPDALRAIVGSAAYVTGAGLLGLSLGALLRSTPAAISIPNAARNTAVMPRLTATATSAVLKKLQRKPLMR